MTNLMSRVKTSLRRVGDWLTGHDVQIATRPPDPELLDQRATARPHMDVLEADGELLLVADVPGAHPDATHVHVDGRRLTILARVPALANAHLLLGSGADADWRTELQLPASVDADHVHASLRDGVLTVHLPKHPRPEPRRIPIATDV